MIRIEVCVDSTDSAILAEHSGADRLEISSCLEVGGITPSIGLVKQIIKRVDLPIMILIRCRSGDFTYTESEKLTMIESMKSFTKFDISGFAVGALTKSGEIDYPFMKEIRDDFSKYNLTFHRAFDYVNDPYVGLEEIEKLNFERILTSGLSDDIIKGKNIIKNLVNLSEKVKIIAGGGITPDNIHRLIKYTDVEEIHVSASEVKVTNLDYLGKNLKMGNMYERKVFNKTKFKKIMNNSKE